MGKREYDKNDRGRCMPIQLTSYQRSIKFLRYILNSRIVSVSPRVQVESKRKVGTKIRYLTSRESLWRIHITDSGDYVQTNILLTYFKVCPCKDICYFNKSEKNKQAFNRRVAFYGENLVETFPASSVYLSIKLQFCLYMIQ